MYEPDNVGDAGVFRLRPFRPGCHGVCHDVCGRVGSLTKLAEARPVNAEHSEKAENSMAGIAEALAVKAAKAKAELGKEESSVVRQVRLEIQAESADEVHKRAAFAKLSARSDMTRRGAASASGGTCAELVARCRRSNRGSGKAGSRAHQG